MRFWTTVMLAISATGGAIVIIEPAWTKVEPRLPASAYYVREYVDKKVEEKTDPLRVSQRDSNKTLERILNSNLRRDLDNEKKDPTFARNPTAQDRARLLQRELDASNARLDAFEKGATVGGTK